MCTQRSPWGALRRVREAGRVCGKQELSTRRKEKLSVRTQIQQNTAKQSMAKSGSRGKEAVERRGGKNINSVKQGFSPTQRYQIDLLHHPRPPFPPHHPIRHHRRRKAKDPERRRDSDDDDFVQSGSFILIFLYFDYFYPYSSLHSLHSPPLARSLLGGAQWSEGAQTPKNQSCFI